MTSITSTVGATTSRIAVRARDEKGKTCFVLYNKDETFDQSGILDDNGAFNYSKEPDQFYAIASHLLTTEHVDEGTPAPDDWNTDADLDRLRRAQFVIVADMSVNPYGASGIAERLDHIAPNAWCVVIGAPPPQYVKGKTTFFLSDTTEGDQKTKHLKYIADPIVDKNDERVFILSTDLPDLLAEINSHPTPLVSGLIALSTPYEGRDEERAQEMKRELAARRATPLKEVDDKKVLAILPERLRGAAQALASKFHVSVFTSSLILLTTFLARHGHKRANLIRGGKSVYPYIGVILVGESGSGKSPLVGFATAPLETLSDMEAERRKPDAARAPALKKLVDEAVKRHESAFLAHDAAKESADTEEIKRAEETEKKALQRLQEATAEYYKIAAPTHNYLPQWASDKGVDWDLSENDWSAEQQGKTPDGALVYFDEGADILGLANGVQTTKKWLAYIGKLLDTTPNTGRTVTHESASGKYGRRKIGASFIIGIQPGAIEVDKIKTITSQGSLNRFYWANIPDVDELPTLDDPDLTEWEQVLKLALNPCCLQLSEGAEKVYVDFHDKDLPRLRRQARDFDEHDKKSSLSKFDSNVIRVAMGFHLIGEATRIIETNDAPLVKREIDADTMRAAVEYCRIAIDERDVTIDTIRKEKKNFVPARSLDAQRMYQHQAKNARDQWTNRSHFSRNTPTLNLWDKGNRERADAAEQELIDAGLWIIGQYGQKAGKRRAITIDEIAAPEKNAETTDNIPF